MAVIEIAVTEQFVERGERPLLRLVTTPDPSPWAHGHTLARRRAARVRMLRRRRRTLVATALLTGVVLLSWPGHAFGGVTGSGLSTDLANGATLASGMVYVVQPGDTVGSIATLVNPAWPSKARAALVRELRSSVVVPGEHVLIP